jgi:hypothetical protein
MKDTYHGDDQIYTTSGSGMHIEHIGKSIIRTPYRDLELNHVLHVPQSSKNLASVHRIASDNKMFFEVHLDFFLLRIGSRGKLFFKEGLMEVFTLYHAAPPHPLSNISFIVAKFRVLGGILASTILLPPLFSWLLARIVFLVSMSPLQK